jgi:predicted 3-demethylubiquinone-9 3-methyltransferase (glyoxalase superfamily)
MRLDLEEQQFSALNGEPQFPFTAAISWSGVCVDPKEANALWARLSEGGSDHRDAGCPSSSPAVSLVELQSAAELY